LLYYDTMQETKTASDSSRGGLAATAALAWPILLGSASMAILEFAERIFLGNYSEAALAASLPGSMMASTFTVVLVSAIGYSATFIAQFHGAGKNDSAGSALFQGLWLALFSIPLFLALIPVGRLVVSLAGHAPAVQNDEFTFFLSYVFVGIASTFSTVLGGFFSGQGRTRLVGFATALGCGCALALNPLLIFTFDLGIAGAGIASVVSFAVTALVLGFCAGRDPIVRNIRGTKFAAFRPQLAWRILRFGLPVGFSFLVANGTFALFMSVFGRFGAETLALGNACFAIHALIFNVICAISAATLIHAGRFFGQRDIASVRQSIRSAIVLSLGATILFFGLLLPFTRNVLPAFGLKAVDDKLTIGVVFLSLMAIRDVFEALQRVLTSGLHGVGDTSFILTVRLIASGLVWTPLFLIAAHAGNAVLVWATMPVSFLFHVLVLYLRWHGKRWTDTHLTD